MTQQDNQGKTDFIATEQSQPTSNGAGQLDFVGIGDTVVDAFIRLKELRFLLIS